MNAVAGLLPVFLILALGALARALGLLDEDAARGLNRLVANIALPALLIVKIGTASLSESFSPAVVGVTTALVLAATLTGLAIARAGRLPRNQVGVLSQAIMRGNLAYVSFPVILAAGGDAALRQAAVTCAVLIPLMNLLAVAVLELARGGHGNAAVARRVAVNPLVIGALGGVLLAAVRWQPWGWLASTLETLSSFALPAALLALGAQLEVASLKRVWGPAATATVLKLAAMPALGLWLLRLLHVPQQGVLVGVLLLAAPTAVASYPVAVELGGDRDLAGACVLLTTVASILTTVAWTVAVRGS